MTQSEKNRLSEIVAEMMYSHKSERSVIFAGEDILKAFPKLAEHPHYQVCIEVELTYNIRDCLLQCLRDSADYEMFGDREEMDRITRDVLDRETADLFDMLEEYLKDRGVDLQEMSDELGSLRALSLTEAVEKYFTSVPLYRNMVEEYFGGDTNAIKFLMRDLDLSKYGNGR